MRARRWAPWVACLWAGALGGCSGAGTGALSGIVSEGTRQAGTVLVGVRVTCAGQHTTTDAQGRYAFASLPTGRQTLTATLAGYDPYVATVEITGLGSTHDVGLKPTVVEWREVERHTLSLDRLGSSIALGPEGEVYVTTRTTIYRLDGRGAVQAQWPAEGLQPNYYGALVVGGDGVLNVLADEVTEDRGRQVLHRGAVLRYDRNGTLLGRVDLPHTGLGGLAFGPDGRIYVCGERGPIAYTPTGEPAASWDLDEGYHMPSDGLVVDEQGMVYVVTLFDDGETEYNEIQSFDATGRLNDWFGIVFSNGGMAYADGVLYPEEDDYAVIYRYRTDGTPLPAIVLPQDIVLDGRSFAVNPRGELVVLAEDNDEDMVLLRVSNRVTSRGVLPAVLAERAGRVAPPRRRGW